MVISVNFHGFQRMVTQTREVQIALANGTRVDHVLDAVQERFPKLPLQREDLIITVNDKVSTMDQLLKERDTVSLLPHIGGG
ncbi:MAG: MoaD/ThiS family protein [Deltaproteobacteria bacterium]|nr:MoaD/ThiS family protein [Deltaproteobacteria bacterium]